MKSAGSMEAVGGEAQETQEAEVNTEASPSRPKKKDNTLLIVGVAAFAIMALKGR